MGILVAHWRRPSKEHNGLRSRRRANVPCSSIHAAHLVGVWLATVLQEEPCNQQLYMLCDIAAANAMKIAERLLKKAPQPGRHPGSIILPKGLFKAMENNTKGRSPSFLMS